MHLYSLLNLKKNKLSSLKKKKRKREKEKRSI